MFLFLIICMVHMGSLYAISLYNTCNNICNMVILIVYSFILVLTVCYTCFCVFVCLERKHVLFFSCSSPQAPISQINFTKFINSFFCRIITSQDHGGVFLFHGCRKHPGQTASLFFGRLFCVPCSSCARLHSTT